MLLAIDVGNTNTVLGLFDGEALVDNWRIGTDSSKTADEYAILLRQLFLISDRRPSLSGAILSSVVPGVTQPLLTALKRRYGLEALVVGAEVFDTMPVLFEPASEVGADRIVNALAAFERYASGVIVVDFGTATTIDCVSPAGEYLGGSIAPGIAISANALFERAAKLPRVEVSQPSRAVGQNTTASIQSGLFYGYAGLVDGIVEQMRAELSFAVKVVATGGLAELISHASKSIDDVDELLTLRGLSLLHQRRHTQSQTQRSQ